MLEKKIIYVYLRGLMYRVEAIEGELNFYDIMLAWCRIVQKKFGLASPAAFGACLNEFADVNDFKHIFASRSDYFVKGVESWVDYNSLPFVEGEFPFIVSTHLIEPGVGLESLSEVNRVLEPGGFALIFYFRVLSFGYLQSCFDRNREFFPSFISSARLRFELSQLNMDVIASSSVSFRPFAGIEKFNAMVSLELMGPALFPFLSTCAFILVRKEQDFGMLISGCAL